MIDDKVKVPVDELTEWVATIVVVPKPGQDSVRISTDYTARFTKKLANKTKPLRDLVRSDAEWYSANSQQEAFNQKKKMFRSPPVLATFDPTLQTFVIIDASNYGLGAKPSLRGWYPMTSRCC